MIIGTGRNGYVAFYRNNRYEVHGDTLLAARNALAAHLKIHGKQHSDINIVLAETNGAIVVHTAT
jgi:hypothetical protein